MVTLASEPFPEGVRRRSARALSLVLAALALALVAGAALLRASPTLAAAEAALAFLALAASAFEWRRARFAEAFALASVATSLVAAVAVGVSGLWSLGAAQGALALVAALTLARRYLVRDEARHLPRLKGKAM